MFNNIFGQFNKWLAGIIAVILGALGLSAADLPMGSSNLLPQTTQTRPAAPANNTGARPTTQLTAAQAEEKALERAGIARNQVTRWDRTELDNERGQLVWEVGFNVGMREYDVDVNANTGAIVKFDNELDW